MASPSALVRRGGIVAARESAAASEIATTLPCEMVTSALIWSPPLVAGWGWRVRVRVRVRMRVRSEGQSGCEG